MFDRKSPLPTADAKIAIGIFVLAAVTFGFFFGGKGWNQDANFDLVRALVERGTLFIDGYDVNTGDVSNGTGGHVYINKPPGLSILATVPYTAIFYAEKLLGIEPDQVTHANAWIVTFAICGLSGALIGAVLYLVGRRKMEARPPAALAAALAVVFGTIVFAYSTMLYAHVPAALFVLLAVVLMRDHPFLAGFAAGVATSCFYVCALAALILAVIAMIGSRRNGLRFIAGSVPVVLALASYQWACFGSPLRTAVEESAPFTEKGLLFGVFRAPRADALYGISFSPYRGLFFASPVLLLALAGVVAMWRRRDLRLEVVAILSITIAFFASIAAFNGWNGGWAFGPRYILPVIPLLGIALIPIAALQSRVVRIVWIAAAAVSIAFNFIAAATDAMPSPDIQRPIGAYLLPAFTSGRIPEETRAKVQWYHDRNVGKVSLPPGSSNLGALLFQPRSRTSVVPIVVWMILGTAWLRRVAVRA